MTVEKPKPKQLLRPITTGADSATNQSQFLEITCNSLKAREKSRVHGAIGFGFASHWLKNWRESFKPITKRSNRNYIVTFDSHLKTALSSKGLNNLSVTPTNSAATTDDNTALNAPITSSEAFAHSGLTGSFTAANQSSKEALTTENDKNGVEQPVRRDSAESSFAGPRPLAAHALDKKDTESMCQGSQQSALKEISGIYLHDMCRDKDFAGVRLE